MLQRLLKLDVPIVNLGTVVVATQILYLFTEALKVMLSFHCLQLKALLLQSLPLTLLLINGGGLLRCEGQLTDLH